MKFGEFVISKGACTEAQINLALKIAAYRKEKLGRLLVELGFLEPKRLDSLLIQYSPKGPTTIFAELKEASDQVPLDIRQRSVFREHQVVPLNLDGTTIHVCGCHFSDRTIQVLEQKFDREVQFTPVESTVLDLLRESGSEALESKISVALDPTPDEKLEEDNPYTHLIRECLKEACSAKASDVHFEPFGPQYLIRFRVHGVLQDWKILQSEHTEPITNKLKWLLNLDLAVVSKPQDSRATFTRLGFDGRVNSMPVAGEREKIVIRLQFQEQKLSLTDIGLGKDKIEVLLRNIRRKEGLIVISGPTGSGKTTTLYALLEEMDRLGKNISTLENPVEKSLERINQSNVEGKEDFYEFQRALMRQDPDVILLGEIRDPETADLSMKLSSTGHLVLSTVHANGAKEVLDRLVNLGVDSYTIKNNLILSVAQRLVRTLCICSIKRDDGLHSINAKGCDACSKGVTGRKAIIEYLEGGDIDQKMPTTLQQEITLLAKRGVIDASELLAFSGQEDE